MPPLPPFLRRWRPIQAIFAHPLIKHFIALVSSGLEYCPCEAAAALDKKKQKAESFRLDNRRKHAV
jgi:hypothetical protein